MHLHFLAKMKFTLTIFCLGAMAVSLEAFAPMIISKHHRMTDRSVVTLAQSTNPLDEMSEERKANLFQFLLRDLEVEGAPLLGCDADQPPTLQAALWTTMAELSEKETEEKACLVLENIPVDALRVFVDDFVLLKLEPRMMSYLPELSRFSISLVGKGVGPALLVECAEWSNEEKEKYVAIRDSAPQPNELAWQGAMKTFVARLIAGKEVCPHVKDNIMAPAGLEQLGISPAPIAYRLVGTPNVCDIMAAFWNCMCELLAVPEDQLGSTILCFPPVPEDADPKEAHNRFSIVAELISRSLFLYRGGDVLDLWHMHPYYDRDLVHPVDKPQHGHLPPTGWVRAMLRASGRMQEAENLTDEQIKLQNYQRRSPLPAVVIKRVSQLEAAGTPENGMIQLDLGGGRFEPASGLATYSKNALRMAEEGQEALQAALKSEMEIAK